MKIALPRRRVRLGPGPQRHGRQARRLRPAAADGGQPRAGAGRPEGGDRQAAHARELHDLLFAWKVAKYVKSNAIVFCKNGMTMGVGAGQMSRLDSARIASIKAEAAQLSLAGHGGGQRRLFPVPRRAGRGGRCGATCVAQPGGSMRDQEVIDAANERGVAMVFTGVRHFRH